MNTPAHVLVNLAVLGGAAPASARRWIAAGALLPDLPMFAFYAWQRLVHGVAEHQIWSQAYFEPDWQGFFDVFNSVPLFTGLALVALAARAPGLAWGCASVLLHCLGDAFLHREDGHRHLWPLSDFRFMSPVSYWDPRHHGAWGAGLELLLVLGSAWLLWGRAGRLGRVGLAAVGALSAAGWLAFYALGWIPDGGVAG